MIDPVDADMLVAAFLDALGETGDSVKALREWSLRHPDLAAEFAAVAVDHTVAEAAPGSADANLQADMMSRMLGQLSMAGEEQPRLVEDNSAEEFRPSNLNEAAQSRGIAYPSELARRLRLPQNILERVASRRIDASTLPAVMVQHLATTLQASRDDVLKWLRGPSAAVAGMPAFVRESASPYRATTSFADAIANAVDIDDVDRAYWASVLSVSRLVSEEE